MDLHWGELKVVWWEMQMGHCLDSQRGHCWGSQWDQHLALLRD